MLKIYLFSTSGISQTEKEELISALPSSLKERASRPIGAKISTERVCAYALLNKLLSDMKISSENIAVSVDEGGKPYVSALSGGFSLSHTDGLVMLAYNEDGGIGCDAEKKQNLLSERIKRIEERFLKKYGGEYSHLDERFKIFTCKHSNGGISITEADVTQNSFEVSKWVLAEAVLKLDGGGFSSLCGIEEIEKNSLVFASSISLSGEKYDIAVATEK